MMEPMQPMPFHLGHHGYGLPSQGMGGQHEDEDEDEDESVQESSSSETCG